MRRFIAVVTALLLFPVALLHAVEPVTSPARPFPQHVAYATGSNRPNHRTQAQMDDDVRAFYDRWKTDFLKTAGENAAGQTRYRVAFSKKGKKGDRTVSEGQGYGMVIVAMMAGHDLQAQDIFDGLHDFALAYPSKKDPRLMNWEVPVKKGADSAFDGDADIAYGLLLAHAQWGRAGKVDYAAAARTRLAGILASTIGPQSRLPLLGDWVEPDGATMNQYTVRSSDFMPGHFRSWGRFTNDPVWNNVADNCTRLVNVLQASSQPQTGLIPDFVIDAKTTPKAPSGKLLESDTDGAYYYNAGRVPFRLGVDALLNGNADSTTQARLISTWSAMACQGDPHKICGGYHMNGKPLEGSDYFTTFFAAPIGVAAMLDAKNQKWLNAIYDSVRAKHEDYFEDSINLQCLLAMSGNYWDATMPANGNSSK